MDMMQEGAAAPDPHVSAGKREASGDNARAISPVAELLVIALLILIGAMGIAFRLYWALSGRLG